MSQFAGLNFVQVLARRLLSPCLSGAISSPQVKFKGDSMFKFTLSLFFLFLNLFLSVNALANSSKKAKPNSPVAASTIKSLVADFYVNKALKPSSNRSLFSQAASLQSSTLGGQKLSHGGGQCDEPEIGSCINAVCSYLPSYSCDDTSELRDIALMCGNNRDGSCIDSICRHMPSYNCDDVSELKEIAKVCSGPVDGKCINGACARMPSYNCDDTSELKNIAQACSGLVDGSCVDAVCSHLPSYNCDDTSEVIDVIRTCKNQ